MQPAMRARSLVGAGLHNYDSDPPVRREPIARAGGPMLEQLIGQKVVIDLRSTFVCIGTLQSFNELYVELRNADLHDLRDTQTTRECYVADSRITGIKRNRKCVWVVRADMVAISRLDDIVDE
jgi:hypothetical protein